MAEEKTNVMRILDQKRVPYTPHHYAHPNGAVDGASVAALLDRDPASVCKTLVTQGASRQHYVFVIPVLRSLDLKAAARAVASGEYDRGIVICTTGIGISIAANKVQGIRCAHCADSLEAEMTRRHNDANMLAIGAGFTGKNLAERMVEVFLSTDFEGGRHERRVNKLNAIQP